jgi:hypothetical protein
LSAIPCTASETMSCLNSSSLFAYGWSSILLCVQSFLLHYRWSRSFPLVPSLQQQLEGAKLTRDQLLSAVICEKDFGAPLFESNSDICIVVYWMIENYVHEDIYKEV